jgi:hypothetical protein
VAILFEEWTTIWESAGTGNSDKTYAVYISKLQHSGMLKGDDITDRFFRILLVGYLSSHEASFNVIEKLQPLYA